MNAQDRMMSRKWGVFNHFLYGSEKGYTDFRGQRPDEIRKMAEEWNDMADSFDAGKLARTLHEIGCGYYFITVMQGTRFMIAPNEAYSRITGIAPGEGCCRRDLIWDIGEALGSCATMTDLVRKASGVFDMDSSVTAEEFANAEDKKSLLIPPDKVVSFPELNLTAREAERLFNGLYDRFSFPDGTYRVYEPNGFYGVGILTDGKLKVKAYIRDNENS